MGGKLPRVGGKIPQGILPQGGQAAQGGQDKLLHRHDPNRHLQKAEMHRQIQWCFEEPCF